MIKMTNNCVFIGRLTADPQLRYTQSGVAYTRFTIAVDRDYKNAQGAYETDFIDILTWRQLAEIVANNLEKGRLVSVEGRLQIESYTDSQGIRRKSAVIVADKVRFLDSKKNGQERHENAVTGVSNIGTEVQFMDEDIPF